MPSQQLPQPTLTISNQDARRFILAHHFLWPPKQLQGKEGIMELFERLGCIQFDTINVVGRNPDLVLQSRVANYRQNLLDELLYQDRKLIDGWDKLASIYPTTFWPYFERHRKRMVEYHSRRSSEAEKSAPEILEQVLENGPMSSLDFDDDRRTDWFWSETKVARAALENLYAKGLLGIHHRVNTRRYFDSIERLVPKTILKKEDPNKTVEAYEEWHVLRRIGSVGIASSNTGEHWYGIRGAEKVAERKSVLARLIEKGEVIYTAIEGIEDQAFLIRKSDLDFLHEVSNSRKPRSKAAFIAPLDNLIWNRKLLNDIFGFKYIWEVYKPPKDREYGYYVLPVLYGDQFIGRIDSKLDSKTNILTVNGFWWEKGIEPNSAMETALNRCLKDFGKYLAAEKIELGNGLKRKKSMGWAKI